RDFHVTGVQTCALPILVGWRSSRSRMSGRSMNDPIRATAFPFIAWTGPPYNERGPATNLRRCAVELQPKPVRQSVVEMTELVLRSEERRVGEAWQRERR